MTGVSRRRFLRRSGTAIGGASILGGCEFAPREDAMARHLGMVATSLATSHVLSGLVLTGGLVAFSVCRALGIGSSVIEAELAPGIPCGRVRGGEMDGVRLVTKAGGFGDAGALVRAIRYLRGDDIDDYQ